MPKDFVSNFVLKIAGILDVFQDFYKQKLGQKIGHFAKREFLEVPYIIIPFFARNGKEEMENREER